VLYARTRVIQKNLSLTNVTNDQVWHIAG
jgi:hypothetical protein